jgi:type IV pilus assembly protein PilQ
MKQSILCGLLVLGCLTPSALAQVPSREARVTLNVAERELTSVVDFLRERSGANIEVIDVDLGEGSDGVVSDNLVSLQLADVHWRTALEIAAEKAHAVVEERQGGVLVVLHQEPVEFTFTDQEISKVIDTIAQVAGANIVVAPEVVGTVSVRFNGVPWRDALEVVAKTRGYVVVEEKGDILRVVDPITLQDQLITQSYQFRYLRPDGDYLPVIKSEFVRSRAGNSTANAGRASGGGSDPNRQLMLRFNALRSLEKALSNGGQMDYIERQNVLIVRDTQQVHEEITAILETLDVEPQQVFVDVKFVSTSKGDLLNLGVDYGPDGPQVSGNWGSIPTTLPFTGGWADGIKPDASLGGTNVIPPTVYGSLSFEDVSPTLRLLQRDTSSEVIQAPKIIALDGHPATIFVGETIRYAEAKSEQGQAGGLQLSLEEASNSPVDVGFQLLLKPQIVPGADRIMLEVIPKETSLSGTGNSSLAPEGFDVFTIGAAGLEGTIALPRTRSSTIVTTMMVDSGQTAVIGGLTTDQETETVQKVPGLWRIPLVGELFKHKSRSRSRRSLMVFLTPSIVYSRDDHEQLLQRELQLRRTRLNDQLEAMVSGDYVEPVLLEN